MPRRNSAVPEPSPSISRAHQARSSSRVSQPASCGSTQSAAKGSGLLPARRASSRTGVAPSSPSGRRCIGIITFDPKVPWNSTGREEAVPIRAAITH